MSIPAAVIALAFFLVVPGTVLVVGFPAKTSGERLLGLSNHNSLKAVRRSVSIVVACAFLVLLILVLIDGYVNLWLRSNVVS